MKEKLKQLAENKKVINVRSQKQYDKLMKILEENGYEWGLGDSPTEMDIYYEYLSETCIRLEDESIRFSIQFADTGFYKNKGCKIITFKEFIKYEPYTFTKSDLKDNHIVELREGTKMIYVSTSTDNFKDLIKSDLTHEYGKHLDIVKVFEFETLVWERKEKPAEILDEVEKKYLSDVIRPWKKEVISIKKTITCENIREYIRINVASTFGLTFPKFATGTMYKGMELNKEYSLKDLGLE